MKQVAAELNIPYNVVKDVIINGQSAYTKHIIRTSNYGSVRWPYFGLFKLKTKQLLYAKHTKGMNHEAVKVYRDVIQKRFYKNLDKDDEAI